jgi:hypothetical protein
MREAIDGLEDIGVVEFWGFVTQVDKGLDGFLFH